MKSSPILWQRITCTPHKAFWIWQKTIRWFGSVIDENGISFRDRASRDDVDVDQLKLSRNQFAELLARHKATELSPKPLKTDDDRVVTGVIAVLRRFTLPIINESVPL